MNGSPRDRGELPIRVRRSYSATTNTTNGTSFRGKLENPQAGHLFQFASCRKPLIGAGMKDSRVTVRFWWFLPGPMGGGA